MTEPTGVPDHASLSVDDLDRAMAFYVTAFGYALLFRDVQDEAIATLTGIPGLRCTLAQLRHPHDGSVLELVCFDPPADAADAIPLRVGHGHVAFRVTDLARAVEAVEALGAHPLGEAVTFTTGRAAYLREPAGSVFELYEPAAGG